MELNTICVFLFVIMHARPTVAEVHTIEVSENTPNDSIIFTFSDSSNDTQCEIEPGNFAIDYLIIDGRNLTIKKPFDLEADNNKLCNLRDRVLQYNCNGLRGVMYIQIKAVDEFPPKFKNNNYTAEFQENNKEGVDIFDFRHEVHDEDCGQERFTFEVQNSSVSNYFVIVNTGKVTVKYSMDFESHQNIFNLPIVAYNDDSDGADNPGNATTMLLIRLRDVDDMNPVFRYSNHTVNIQEQNNSWIGKWLQTSPPVHAYDQDFEHNETLRYLFIETIENFEINNETGMVRVDRILDRENQPSYRYLIRAEQVNSMERSAISQIIINVVDINDNCAVFETSPKTLMIPENLHYGTYVYSVFAHDLDEGENAMFNYTIEGDAFHIDPGTGKISVKNSTVLDRETVEMFIVNISTVQWQPTVEPCDEHLELNITLLDVNDNTPVFTRPQYTFTVKDDKPPQIIGKVSATDKDYAENQRVTYSIEGSVGDYFQISQSEGEITLQRQSTIPVTFAVKACDNPHIYSQRRCAVVMVYVFNDDNSTTEGYDIQGRIEENREAGSIVKEISFISIQSTFQLDDDTHFELDRNLLKTKMVLDRESKEHYAVRLIANNGTMDTESYNINITVIDMNDNPPVFTEEHYTFKLPDTVSVGSVLGTVKATDEDNGINAIVSYFAEGNRASEFSVNSSTGQITVAKLPHISQENQFIFLNIRATDSGTPNLQSFIEVQIIVGDGDTTVAILVGASKEKIEEERLLFDKSLSDILMMNVQIKKVSVYGDGSVIHISATNKTDNADIPLSYLNRKVKEYMDEIQAIFYRKQNEPKDFSGESVALMCVAGVMLMGSLFLVALVFKKHKKYQRFKSLFASLSRKNSFYETRETSIAIEDDLSDHTKSKSLSNEEFIQNEVIANGRPEGGINQESVNDVDPHVTLEETRGSISTYDDNTSHKSVENMCLNTKVNEPQPIPDHVQSQLARESCSSSEDFRCEKPYDYTTPYIPPVPPVPPVTPSSSVVQHSTFTKESHLGSLPIDRSSKPFQSAKNTKCENVFHELHSTVVKFSDQGESGNQGVVFNPDEKTVNRGLKFENETDEADGKVTVDTSDNEPESRDEPEPDYAKRVRFNESRDINVDTKSSKVPDESKEDVNTQMEEGWQGDEIHSPDSTINVEDGTFAFGESEITEL